MRRKIAKNEELCKENRVREFGYVERKGKTEFVYELAERLNQCKNCSKYSLFHEKHYCVVDSDEVDI